MAFFAYSPVSLVFLVLDAIWLAMMGPSYRAVMGDMLAPTIRLAPAGVFYVVDMLGIMVFVARPGARNGAAWVVAHGALFGLFTYATYDLTNYAVLKNWSLGLTLEDIVWGMVVTAIVSTVAWAVVRDRGRRRR